MDDRTDKAFDFAQDTTKQLLTLATGLTAISITFFHDFASTAPAVARSLMAFAWVAYLVSVIAGLLTLMALTGTLQPRTATTTTPSIRGGNIIGPSVVQVVFFAIAAILTVAAGLLALA